MGLPRGIVDAGVPDGWETGMNIIVVGAGKIGSALAGCLSDEGHNITVIESNPDRVSRISNNYDVMTICAEGDIDSLKEAGAEKADLLIAATNSDESNILCCLVGRKLGVKNTVARVREEANYREVLFLEKELGLSLVINPELACANRISRMLRFPASAQVDSFAHDEAELAQFELKAKNPLCGTALADYHRTVGDGTLVAAVMRDGNALLPQSDFRFMEGDTVLVVGPPHRVSRLARKLHVLRGGAESALIVGGGRIGAYLARELVQAGVGVTLIESDQEIAEEVKDQLPQAEVICDDGTQPSCLDEAGIESTDAFVALTGMDEVNTILCAYARSRGVAKAIAKVSEAHFVDMASTFGLEDPMQPQVIIAEQVLQHVRGIENSARARDVELQRSVIDGQIEVLEFLAKDGSPCLDTPLSKLSLREGALVAAIIHGGVCAIPTGSSTIHAGDRVLVVTTHAGMTQLEDILKD